MNKFKNKSAKRDSENNVEPDAGRELSDEELEQCSGGFLQAAGTAIAIAEGATAAGAANVAAVVILSNAVHKAVTGKDSPVVEAIKSASS